MAIKYHILLNGVRYDCLKIVTKNKVIRKQNDIKNKKNIFLNRKKIERTKKIKEKKYPNFLLEYIYYRLILNILFLLRYSILKYVF